MSELAQAVYSRVTPLLIETAPLTEIILVFRPNNGWDIAYWDPEKHHKSPQPHWVSKSNSFLGVRWARAHMPTHWLPLPPDPV